MLDGDTVPALPIRTRVGSNLRKQGSLLTPESNQIGKLKRWSDYTPAATTPGALYPPTPTPGTTPGIVVPSLVQGGRTPKSTLADMSVREPVLLFDKTPTPMDQPYFPSGPGFGFALPTQGAGMQPAGTFIPAGTFPNMQPAMMQPMTMQTDGSMQPMAMQPMLMPVNSSAATMMQPMNNMPAQPSMPSGQQMVFVGMVPVAAQPSQSDEAEHEKDAKAGRQIFSEALNASTFEDRPRQAVSPNGPLPSPGSALHGTGRCNPCAWFWKPKGCMNAVKCTYCHLCPEGELKNRKKAKVTAMRMGALEPSNQGAPPQIRLTQLLGDE